MPLKNEKKWYNSYYNNFSRYSRLKNYWNLIHLKKLGFFSEVSLDSIIVDIGCGNSNMLNTLYKKGYRKLYGFDVKIPETVVDSFSVIKGSMLEMPYKNGFADVLICFNVMHHLLDYSQYSLFLKNCERVLKKNGRLFLVEPQKNLFRKLQDILIKLPLISEIGPIKWQKTANQEEKEELKIFLEANIKEIFKTTGFKIITYRSFLKSFVMYCRLD